MSGTIPEVGRAATNEPVFGVGRLSVPPEGEASIGRGRRSGG